MDTAAPLPPVADESTDGDRRFMARDRALDLEASASADLPGREAPAPAPAAARRAARVRPRFELAVVATDSSSESSWQHVNTGQQRRPTRASVPTSASPTIDNRRLMIRLRFDTRRSPGVAEAGERLRFGRFLGMYTFRTAKLLPSGSTLDVRHV